ncbi:interferon gamma receptor 2 isoform X2 [Diceros bicornis minor]|uniref:interferon gamma receptor 2 isoform X2 n=1 Tax=Diceros bicornis minor TaxID=77932 RepID=UPI0026F2C64F|nr:interferon gamma receptor 2 isoform X2 [Diceros bicornis minor]
MDGVNGAIFSQRQGCGDMPRSTDSLSQLPAPQNPKIRLYNAEQVLSWEPVSPSNGSGPVVYQVQFKYTTSTKWSNVNNDPEGVNCMKITVTECNFTKTNISKGFPLHFNVSLRVRAELEERISPWVTVPWFQHYRNVTIGPPENIWVTPGEGSLIVRLSPPFDIHDSMVVFQYYVHYWEKAGIQQDESEEPLTGVPQVKGPFMTNSIVLNALKPLRVYCLRVQAWLLWTKPNVSRPGHLSNISCSKTMEDASTKLQQVILIAMGTFLLLLAMAGACLFMVLKYRGLVKYWFQSPPSIPVQIEEYLKDPAQPILEVLDKDSSPKEEACDSVSVVLFPEKEEEGVLQSTLKESIDLVHQPAGRGLS